MNQIILSFMMILYVKKTQESYETQSDSLDEVDINFPGDVYCLKACYVDFSATCYNIYVLSTPSMKYKRSVSENISFTFENATKVTCVVPPNSQLYKDIQKKSIFRAIIQYYDRVFVSDLLYLKEDNTIVLLKNLEHIELILYVWFLIIDKQNSEDSLGIDELMGKILNFDSFSNEQQISKIIFNISLIASTNISYEWIMFMANIGDLDYTSSEWLKYSQIINDSLEWLKANHKQYEEYINKVKQFTQPNYNDYLETNYYQFNNMSEHYFTSSGF